MRADWTHPAFPPMLLPSVALYWSGKAPRVWFELILFHTRSMNVLRTPGSVTVAEVSSVHAGERCQLNMLMKRTGH